MLVRGGLGLNELMYKEPSWDSISIMMSFGNLGSFIRQFTVIRWPLLLGNLVYRQVSNISRNLVGNEIVDHSDVVGASPVGAAPTTSSFST